MSARAGCNLSFLENLFDNESSSFLQCYLVRKLFCRQVLKLVATFAGWKAFSTTSPRAGCNLGWLETISTTSPRAGWTNCNIGWLKNLFDDESLSWLHWTATLARWKTISTTSARAACNLCWLVNLLTSPRAGCNLRFLQNLFDDECSSWLQP